MVLESAPTPAERFMDTARDKVEQREKQDAGVYEVHESAAPPEHHAVAVCTSRGMSPNADRRAAA